MAFLFAAGAAVGLPDVDALAVLHEGREAFAEAEDLLADAECRLDGHMVGAVGGGDEGGALAARLGEGAARRIAELQGPGLRAVQAQPEGSGGEFDDGSVLVDRALGVPGGVEGEVGARAGLSGVVGDADADDSLSHPGTVIPENNTANQPPGPAHSVQKALARPIDETSAPP